MPCEFKGEIFFNLRGLCKSMLEALDSDYILRIDLIPEREFVFQGFGGNTRIMYNR
jgi:hypothetical protein